MLKVFTANRRPKLTTAWEILKNAAFVPVMIKPVFDTFLASVDQYSSSPMSNR